MINTTTMRDYYGRIIGYIDVDSSDGKETARDYYKRIIGTYDKNLNVTRDYYGRIIAKGNMLSGLIVEAEANIKLKEKRK